MGRRKRNNCYYNLIQLHGNSNTCIHSTRIRISNKCSRSILPSSEMSTYFFHQLLYETQISLEVIYSFKVFDSFYVSCDTNLIPTLTKESDQLFKINTKMREKLFVQIKSECKLTLQSIQSHIVRKHGTFIINEKKKEKFRKFLYLQNFIEITYNFECTYL